MQLQSTSSAFKLSCLEQVANISVAADLFFRNVQDIENI